MATPEQDTNQELPPIIPSWVLIGLAVLAVLVGLFVAVFQGEFGFLTGVSWLIALIAFFAWALMFPQQFIDFFRGRSVTLGGWALIVTIALIVASGIVYYAVKQQSLSIDLSKRDIYSLDEQVRTVLVKMAQDPRIPSVTFIGLYGPSDASDRDRFEVLFKDMSNLSNGKISYKFVDPNREVRFLEPYANGNKSNSSSSSSSSLRSRQVIVAVNDKDTGEPSTQDFQIVASGSATTQFDLLNAILQLSAVGDLRAYFLSVNGALDITQSDNNGVKQFSSDLEKNHWTVEQVSPLQISGDNPQYKLNDPAADAEVIVMAGGSESLDDTSMSAIQNYAANGGDLVILSGINTQGGPATAQADNMANFLWDNYGVRFRDDLVLDPDNSVGNPETIVIKTYGSQQIVDGLNSASDWLVMENAHSIEIADPVPDGVTVTTLATTTDAGYAKAGFDFSKDPQASDLAQADGDLSGKIVVGVAVENANTGSRIVLFGSDALLKNGYRKYREVVSPEVVTSAIAWASNAQNFADDLLKIVPKSPTQDSPIFVKNSDLGWMSFVVIILLPFGVLALGVLGWWLQRPSRTGG